MREEEEDVGHKDTILMDKCIMCGNTRHHESTESVKWLSSSPKFPYLAHVPIGNLKALESVVYYARKHHLIAVAYSKSSGISCGISWDSTGWTDVTYPLQFWPTMLDPVVRLWPAGTPREIYEKEGFKCNGKTFEQRVFPFNIFTK